MKTTREWDAEPESSTFDPDVHHHVVLDETEGEALQIAALQQRCAESEIIRKALRCYLAIED